VNEISQSLFHSDSLHQVKQDCFLDSPYLQKGQNHKLCSYLKTNIQSNNLTKWEEQNKHANNIVKVTIIGAYLN
jgi:hypothetical protein